MRRQVVARVASRCTRDGRAAWTVLLAAGAHERLIAGRCSDATPNGAAVRSVLEAFRALRFPCAVELRFSSYYLGQSHGSLQRWSDSGWLRAPDPETGERQPVAHADLWRDVIAAIGGGDHRVTWRCTDGAARNCERDDGDLRVERLAAEELAKGASAAPAEGDTSIPCPPIP